VTEIELELTYLARELPADLATKPSKMLVDVYYPATDPHPLVRIRQKGDSYEITKKVMASGTDSSHMLEHTIKLTREEFDALSAAPGKRVAKRRYDYEFEGRTAEIDVFDGELSGLVVVDFEFTDRDDQLAFQMPGFCLADVTQEAFIAGGKLAGKSYADISADLDRYDYQQLYIQEA
jgi:adenylate cyclase